MNTIPANVQAQGDRADALLTAIAKGEDPGQAGQAPPVEDPGAHKPAVAVADEETVDGLKHKLSVLQGKYNSEIQAIKDDVNLLNNLKGQVRNLTGQLRDTNGRLQEANALIISLQKQITKVDPPDAGGDKSLITDEDREWLRNEGMEDRFLEIVQKVARGEAAKHEPAQSGDLENVKRDLHQQRVDTFWKELSGRVPDWEGVNASDDFNDWLDTKLPYSTKDRRSVLQDAQAQLDYGTVIQLFQDFKGSSGAAKQEPVKQEPVKQEPVKQEPVKPKREHVIDPVKQLEPDSGVGHVENPNGETPGGRTYTRQWIRDFYKDVATGKYKGKAKEAEAARTDADIIKANAEGRIRD